MLSEGMQLSEDVLISSVQSKYIKFLGFFDEFPEYLTKQPIVYIDHKVELDHEKVSLSKI